MSEKDVVKQANPTLNPVTRLDSGALEKVAAPICITLPEERDTEEPVGFRSSSFFPTREEPGV